jgi:hypothetical protein
MLYVMLSIISIFFAIRFISKSIHRQ